MSDLEDRFVVETKNMSNDAALETPYPVHPVVQQDWKYDEEEIRRIKETPEPDLDKFRY